MLIRTLHFSGKICLNQSIFPKQLNRVVNNGTRQFGVSTTQHHKFQIRGEDRGILIYEGPLTSRIRAAKIFSITSSAVGLAMQPVLYQKTLEAQTGVAVMLGGAIFLGFFTFVTPVLLHLVSRKYVTQLYYNPKTEEFTAFTFNIFLVPKVTVFKAEDVTRPELPTMFASFFVQGKPLFADPENFTDIDLYKKMMGYDKPVDMKLRKPEINKPANLQ